MLAVHLLDALSILPLVEAHARGAVLDVGSGAGLPAIPLAIMRGGSVWSVDAVAKKIGFQTQVKATLGLDCLHPVHARIETVEIGEPVSLIVSRAFAEIGKMLADVDRLVTADTTVLAMKGVTPTAELAALPAGWQVRRDRSAGRAVPRGRALRCDPAARSRPRRGGPLMARIFAIANQKGGVGKTTTTVNLAAALAALVMARAARRSRPAGQCDDGLGHRQARAHRERLPAAARAEPDAVGAAAVARRAGTTCFLPTASWRAPNSISSTSSGARPA